ncbi:cell envelope integrity protein TolA [Pseudomonas sp. A3.4]|nr:cell envelope integrity protein TolA [Atopomonas sediminilitoris]
MFALLFVSFQFTPDLPPARPIVKATLVSLKSKSPAQVQTNQKIAGEAQKTAAQQYEAEQLEQKKADDKKLADAKKAEAMKKQAEAQKQAEAKKAEAQKAEAKKQAEIAKKKAADEAAKKKAAEDAKKKAAEEAKKKAAAEQARKKAAADAKKAAEDAKRKAQADAKAKALAELMSDEPQYQMDVGDDKDDEVTAGIDARIVQLVSEQWSRPPSARNGMSVTVLIEMLPSGQITNVSLVQSSGDAAFDQSAISAVKNVGRIHEMIEIDRATFERKYRKREMIFKPEDLSL